MDLATTQVYCLYDQQYVFVAKMRQAVRDCTVLATVETVNSCTQAATDIFDLIEDDLTNRLYELNDLAVNVVETAVENANKFIEDTIFNIEDSRQNILADLTSCALSQSQ